MTTIELKKRLHESIDQINDDTILKTVYDMLENGNEIPEGLLANHDFLDKLEQGMNDIENGRTISLTASNQQIEEWLLK